MRSIILFSVVKLSFCVRSSYILCVCVHHPFFMRSSSVLGHSLSVFFCAFIVHLLSVLQAFPVCILYVQCPFCITVCAEQKQNRNFYDYYHSLLHQAVCTSGVLQVSMKIYFMLGMEVVV